MALYHTANGIPVEVKKHQLMGPVGYTKVGSPTITDGVVSGFSESKYLSIQNSPTGIQTFNYKVKIAIHGVTSGDFPTIYRFLGHYMQVRPDTSSKATLRFYYPGGNNAYFVNVDFDIPFTVEEPVSGKKHSGKITTSHPDIEITNVITPIKLMASHIFTFKNANVIPTANASILVAIASGSNVLKSSKLFSCFLSLKADSFIMFIPIIDKRKKAIQ